MAEPSIADIISLAVSYATGQNPVIPESAADRYFIGDTIIRLAEALRKYGHPSVEMHNMSIEVSELTPDECQNAHITIRSHDQLGLRDADALGSIIDNLNIMSQPDYGGERRVTLLGQTFAHDVCSACHTFVRAICTLHKAGLTFAAINDKVDSFWATYIN